MKTHFNNTNKNPIELFLDAHENGVATSKFLESLSPSLRQEMETTLLFIETMREEGQGVVAPKAHFDALIQALPHTTRENKEALLNTFRKKNVFGWSALGMFAIPSALVLVLLFTFHIRGTSINSAIAPEVTSIQSSFKGSVGAETAFLSEEDTAITEATSQDYLSDFNIDYEI